MAKVELTVEINDESLLATIAEVKEKQRELNKTIIKLEEIVTGGRYGGVPLETKETPRT